MSRRDDDFVLLLTAKSGGTPTPTPPAVKQKVVFSGHSWTQPSTLSNYTVYYIAGHPDASPSTVGVGGHTLANWESIQLPLILAADPGVVVVHLETNDYPTYPVAANYLAAFWAKIAPIKAQLPNCKLVIVAAAAMGTAAMTGGRIAYAGFNTWAADVAAGIRAQKGILYDEIIDLFAVPGLDTEAAANNTNYWNADALHITWGGTHRFVYPVVEPAINWMLGHYNSVFLKLVDLEGQTASATGLTSSVFTIAGLASTEVQTLTPGGGLQFKKNGGSATSTPTTFVNGDTLQLVANAPASGTSTFTFVLGDTTYTWNITVTGTEAFNPSAQLGWWDASDSGSAMGERKLMRLRDKAGTHDLWSWGNNNEPDRGNPTYNINGRKTAKFDGTMKLWGDTSAQFNNGGVVYPDSFDFLWVGWHDGGTGWDASTTYLFALADYADGDPRIFVGNNGAAAPGLYRMNAVGVGTVVGLSATAPTAATPHLVRIRAVDNDRMYLYIDGVLQGNSGAGPFTGFGGNAISVIMFATNGGTAETKGLFAEAVMCNPLSAGQLASAHAYFNAKYGMSLP